MQKIALLVSAFVFFGIQLHSQNFVSYLYSQNSVVNTLSIDSKNSVINWKGFNVFKVNKHYGTVNFISGQIKKMEGRIVGGDFKIDMKSIINSDGAINNMLIDHLKNEDFFDIEKFPFAYLEIIKIDYQFNNTIMFKAKLTIKDVTNLIEFNAKTENIEGREIMTSKFNIDRTRWGIMYESKSFLGGVQDDVISDLIEFEVVIQWPFNEGC